MTNRKSVLNYIALLESKMDSHKLQERLDAVTELRAEYPADKEIQAAPADWTSRLMICRSTVRANAGKSTKRSASSAGQ